MQKNIYEIFIYVVFTNICNIDEYFEHEHIYSFSNAAGAATPALGGAAGGRGPAPHRGGAGRAGQGCPQRSRRPRAVGGDGTVQRLPPFMGLRQKTRPGPLPSAYDVSCSLFGLSRAGFHRRVSSQPKVFSRSRTLGLPLHTPDSPHCGHIYRSFPSAGIPAQQFAGNQPET